MVTGISYLITWKSDQTDSFTLTRFRIFNLSYFPTKFLVWRKPMFKSALASFGFNLSVFHEKNKIKKVFFFETKLKKLFFEFFFLTFYTRILTVLVNFITSSDSNRLTRLKTFFKSEIFLWFPRFAKEIVFVVPTLKSPLELKPLTPVWKIWNEFEGRGG